MVPRSKTQSDFLPVFLFGLMTAVSMGALLNASPLAAAEPEYDVVIYGGTSGGVSAAIQARRMGKSVILIEPGKHLGGLTVSGLGQTDSGNKAAIGGISREFYQRVRKYYSDPSVWKQEQQNSNSSYKQKSDAMWTFEPHVAEKLLRDWIEAEKVTVLLGEALNRESGVQKQGNRIQSIELKSGKRITGRRFLDATYEGDLLATAGVSFTVGREANDQYGETLNGIQVGRSVSHQFVKPVDPYLVQGDPSSGLLPGINPEKPGPDGAADSLVQAYNFRICMTDDPENRVPFTKPDGYDPQQHELLLRNYEAGDMRLPLSIGRMPNRKTDLNNKFAVSTDWIGMNHAYPEADDETRAKILKDHEIYVRGFLWTLANHPRVPEEIRQQASRWGYSKDEFVDNDYFPFWCYIREGRRMVGMYVQTELDCRRIRICDDAVGLGSYNMDSHNCQRYVDETGHVRNEGDVQVSPQGGYAISARALLPKPEECENLAVPVCLSSTHIAYGSIRMEPVFMILGQSAATLACLSLDGDRPLHEVPYAELRQRLLADHQILEIPAPEPPVVLKAARDLPGIVVDDTDAKQIGEWRASSSAGQYIGASYLHDGSEEPGKKSLVYTLRVPEAGRYDVRFGYTASGNRATNALVKWDHGGRTHERRINQKKTPPFDGMFISLGEVICRAGDTVVVTVSNDQADGYVASDAVQLLRKK